MTATTIVTLALALAATAGAAVAFAWAALSESRARRSVEVKLAQVSSERSGLATAGQILVSRIDDMGSRYASVIESLEAELRIYAAPGDPKPERLLALLEQGRRAAGLASGVGSPVSDGQAPRAGDRSTR
jgi:hypothetical protein